MYSTLRYLINTEVGLVKGELANDSDLTGVGINSNKDPDSARLNLTN